MFKKLLQISVMFAASASLNVHAAPMLSVSPASQSIALNDSTIVNIIVSGLEDGGANQIVSFYDLTLSFDSSIINSFSGAYFGLSSPPSLDTSSPGFISWTDVSLVTDDSALQTSQGDSLTLASITFKGLSAGVSALSFSYHELIGLGGNLLSYTVQNSSIRVTDGSVPEPSVILLLGLGALGMVGAKRRKADLADV